MAAPLFSVVTPVHDPPVEVWRACVQSMVEQVERDWEWIVVADGPQRPEIAAELTALAAAEQRVRLITRQVSSGIVIATNEGIAAATGTYLAFLDHDDSLHHDALAHVAALRPDDPDLVYTDEVIVDVDGEVIDPVHKPEWSPERLRAQNYINHFTVIRRRLVAEVGGLREGLDGSQDHDLLLRVGERAKRVARIPYMLYRWRMAPDSVLTTGLGGKPLAWEAGRRAVQEHCDRTGIDAEVGELEVPGIARWYRVRRRLADPPSVNLIVPVRMPAPLGVGAVDDPVRAVRAAVKLAGYEPMEVVLAVTADAPAALVEEVAAAAGPGALVVRAGPEVTSPAALANHAAVRSNAAQLIFLDSTTEVQTQDWVGELVGFTVESGVGAVGGRLLSSPDVLEQAGYALVNGAPEQLLRTLPTTTTAYAGIALVPGERSAVSGACLAVSRAAFTQVGGFSTAYAGAYQDVDLCLKLQMSGYRVLYVPFVDVLWHGRTIRHAEHDEDLGRLRLRWRQRLTNDPYINPNVRKATWLTSTA